MSSECGNQALASVAALAVGATVLTAVIKVGSEVVRETQDRTVAVLNGETIISDTATSAVVTSPDFGNPLSKQAAADELQADDSLEERSAQKEAHAKQISHSFRTAIRAAITQSDVAVVTAPPSPETPGPERPPTLPATTPSPTTTKPEPSKEDPPEVTANPSAKDPVKSPKPNTKPKPKPKNEEDTEEEVASSDSQTAPTNATTRPVQGTGVTPQNQLGSGFPAGPSSAAPMFGGSFGAAPTTMQQPYSSVGQTQIPGGTSSPSADSDSLSTLLGLLNAQRPPAVNGGTPANEEALKENRVKSDLGRSDSAPHHNGSMTQASSTLDSEPDTAVSKLLDSVISPSASASNRVQSQTKTEHHFKKSEAITVTTVDRSEPGMPRLHIVCRKPFRQIHVEGGGHNLAFNAPLPGQPRSIPLDPKVLEPGTAIRIIGIEETSAELLTFVVPAGVETELTEEQLAPANAVVLESETQATVQLGSQAMDSDTENDSPLKEQ